MGYVIYKLSNRQDNEADGIGPLFFSRLFLVITVLSLLPDFDAVPGILMGNLGRFHNNGSHSFFVGITIALLGALIMRWVKGEKYQYWFLLIFSCYGLHIVMDFFTYGRGVMVFWPLSTKRYLSPILLFYGLHWSDGIFSIKHFWTLLNETGFVLLVLLGLRGAGILRKKKRSRLQNPGI